MKQLITLTREEFIETMRIAAEKFVDGLTEQAKKEGKEVPFAGLMINLEMPAVTAEADKMLFGNDDSLNHNGKKYEPSMDGMDALIKAMKEEHGGK